MGSFFHISSLHTRVDALHYFSPTKGSRRRRSLNLQGWIRKDHVVQPGAGLMPADISRGESSSVSATMCVTHFQAHQDFWYIFFMRADSLFSRSSHVNRADAAAGTHKKCKRALSVHALEFIVMKRFFFCYVPPILFIPVRAVNFGLGLREYFSSGCEKCFWYAGDACGNIGRSIWYGT